MKTNLINGQKPEFGNIEQIKILQENQKVMSGEINFHQIEWERARYIGGGDGSKPVFKYTDKSDYDCLVDYIPCPKCKRYHILLICHSESGVEYEDVLEIDREAKEGFECWNCGLEFEVDDDRNVYVKQNIEI